MALGGLPNQLANVVSAIQFEHPSGVVRATGTEEDSLPRAYVGEPQVATIVTRNPGTSDLALGSYETGDLSPVSLMSSSFDDLAFLRSVFRFFLQMR